MMKIGIVGAGNMAQALLVPLKEFFQDQKHDLFIYTPTQTRAKLLAEQLEANVVSALEELSDCSIVILAHKPQQLKDVASKLKLSSSGAIISMLASIDCGQLEESFGTNVILRLMPNTPAQIGQGVVTCFTRSNNESVFRPWLNALSKSSIVEKFEDESLIDLTTPELGSGPGMVLELIRIFSDSLVSKGIEVNKAKKLAAKVFHGSGEMAGLLDESPSDLRDKVTSKGGITQECLNSLSQSSIEKIFHESFKAGHNRAIELKKSK
jgi:pyrroline-5-carboxylate reductase